MNKTTALFGLSLITFLALSSVSLIYAAAPDGSGPWADSVISTAQGLRKNGTAVPAPRSDPTSTLGVAENDTIDGHFFSLGFGGVITLHFDNGISSGVVVVEATNPSYPVERASVELSSDGTTWITAGSVNQDGSVPIPSGLTCANYARITDTSNPADFADATADGFDVDGVQAQGAPCSLPTPTPTPTASPSCSPTTTTVIIGTTGNTTVSFGSPSRTPRPTRTPRPRR